jgi:hypothetical protein
MAVLIAVPKVQPPRARRAGLTTNREEWRQVPLRRPRTRRRLRRGVRITAWSCLALLPILGGGAFGWAGLASRSMDRPAWRWIASASARDQDRDGRTASIRSDEPATAAIDVRAVFPESHEPAIGAPVADVEVPVIIPGYLLPDDSLEEPVHEGS